MKRLEVNVQTGEVTEVDLTPEEIAALPPAGSEWPAVLTAELNAFFALRADIFNKCSGIRQEYEDQFELGQVTEEARDIIRGAVLQVRAALSEDGWKAAPGTQASITAKNRTALNAALTLHIATTKAALPPLAKAAWQKVDR